MAVVKRRHQADVIGEQHAVPKDIARHVADTHDGEFLRLGVTTQFAEVALDRLPCTTRGDAHDLVVVAHRSTGSEGVPEPETVVASDSIGDVGESRRALVRRHHQVGVIGVMAYHSFGRNNIASDQIVGDVEQSRDERAVAGDAFGQHGFAINTDRWPSHDEPALGADWDDHSVFDHLSLYQPEDLGAEILVPVTPSQPATGDPPEP
jgi:hypothetical protein